MHYPVLPHLLHVFSWLFLLTSGYFILGPQPPQLVWAVFLSHRAERATCQEQPEGRALIPHGESGPGSLQRPQGWPQLPGWPRGSLPRLPAPTDPVSSSSLLGCVWHRGQLPARGSCLLSPLDATVPLPAAWVTARSMSPSRAAPGAGGAGEAGTAHPGARGAGGSRTSDPAPAAAPGTAADIQSHRLGCTRSTFAQFAAGSSGTSVYFHGWEENPTFSCSRSSFPELTDQGAAPWLFPATHPAGTAVPWSYRWWFHRECPSLSVPA